MGLLQIERKIAPFWRGLNDFDDQWAEHQIIAAARGLPIPPADQTPPDELVPRPLSSAASPSASTQNLNNLTVPMGPRTQSVASDRSASNVGSALPSPTGQGSKSSASPFKPRTKALAAALSLGSRNGSSADLAPREINLPNDPFVNGQPLEVFLYKEGTECPICFLYYPPYLNHTRCCDQAICSECFVQIKRPDPHFPEGHGDGEQAEPSANPEEQSGLLISEPAQCPYCQQTEFGVTYDPPPFRRGLAYATPPAVGTMSTAMSSSSSLNSAALSPTPMSPPPSGAGAGRRRTQSLSANAPNVITTDRVRPDWAAKLAAQRNHQARRAAAATALHTAAFLMGDSGSRTFGRMSRFSRRNTNSESSNSADGNAGAASTSGAAAGAVSGPEPGPRNSSGRALLAGPAADRRQSHMENLENMMLAEAIRLSLAAEEERKRKAEKEEKKDAKRREKEERKAAKAAAKGHPYSGSGQSSTNGSTLSLPGLGAIGRRRGNSAASNLRMEATTANAVASTANSSGAANAMSAAETGDKGKGVDRGPAQTSPETEVGKANVDALHPDKAPTSAPRPVPSPHQHAGPSHLRQMSNASSGSSQPDSQAGSYQNQSCLQEDPHASGVSLAGRSDASDEPGAVRSGENENDDTSSTEPMFNYRSLAQMVGVEMDGVNAGRRLSQIGESHAEDEVNVTIIESQSDDKRDSVHEASAEHTEDVSSPPKAEDDDNDKMSKSVATLTQEMMNAGQDDAQKADGTEATQSSGPANTPQLMVTPETPVPDDDGAESKQLGFQGTRMVEIAGEITH
jgi:hypothetical protein